MKMQFKTTINTVGRLLGSLMFVAVLASCKKDLKETFQPDRFFAPGRIKVEQKEEQAKLDWDASLHSTGRKLTYSVEISEDSAFAQPAAFKAEVDTTSFTITNKEIKVRTKYFARVRANSEGVIGESLWQRSNSFSMTGEQILIAPLSTELGANSVIIRWKPADGLTKIVFTPPTGQPIEALLSAQDLSSNSRLVTGLMGGVIYQVEIYAGTASKGMILVAMKEEISGTIIDLSGITDKPGILQDTIPDVAAGVTILLAKGVEYRISGTTTINKSVTIASKEDITNPQQASIYFTSNFTLAGNLDYVKFINVKMRSDNYASRYVFNVNSACNVGEIKFEDCSIGAFRGISRFQNQAILISQYTISNCTVDSIKDYSAVIADGAACQVANITFSKSTFSKMEKFIVSTKPDAPVNSITIDECTIYDAPLGGTGVAAGNALIDAKVITQPVQFSNTILGPGWKRDALNNTIVKGIIYTTGSVVATNSYVVGAYSAPTGAIPGVIATYVKPIDELFENPGAGNFRIIDATFPGKVSAGDPRWRN